MYSVKEIFYTLQGEGANAGRAAVFCRFAGCNLWSGREQDRATAQCLFCDTDFVGTDGPGGARFVTASNLAQACRDAAGAAGASLIVLTGGEPMLQVDDALIDALHAAGFEIAIETNGTLPVPRLHRLDLRQPQSRHRPRAAHGPRTETGLPAGRACSRRRFEGSPSSIASCSPWTAPTASGTPSLAVAYCKAHPRWRLSLQSHKLIGIP